MDDARLSNPQGAARSKATHSHCCAHIGPNLSAHLMHASMLEGLPGASGSGDRITQAQQEELRGPSRRQLAQTPGAADSLTQRAQPTWVSTAPGSGMPGTSCQMPSAAPG
jgi:hypothetical protein